MTMRLNKILISTLPILLALSGCSLFRNGKQYDFFGYDVAEHRLKNGLTVILVENHTVPVVSYQTWFKVGSVDEQPGIRGMAHLFEHLMFKGTKKYPAKQFFRQLEAKGAEVNAYTTRDYTVYYEVFTPNLLDKVIDMESDRLANIEFNEEALQTERQVVYEERKLRTENSPSGKMTEAIWELSFQRHPYRWPIIGYNQDLATITTDDLKVFFEKYYSPSNATIVVVGDINTEATLEKIRKAYGAIPKGKPNVREIPEDIPPSSEKRKVIFDYVASETSTIAFPVTSAHSDDSYSLDVLANILFFGTSSRAHRKFVEEEQIALSVSGSAFTPTYPGLFMVRTAMKGEEPTEKAEKLFAEIMSDIQKNGVTQEEVDVAAKQLIVQVLSGIQTSSGLGSLIGTVKMILGSVEEYGSEVEKYREVTRESVQRVAKEYFSPNRRSVVILKPKGRS